MVTTKVLHHLKEIDQRKLYSDLKCSSLFDYCVRELGYSESSAYRRIVACRMLYEIPSIEKKIEAGVLSLTNIGQVEQFFKDADPKTKEEALENVEGLSKMECEQKLFEMTGTEKKSKEKKERLSPDKVKVSIILSDAVLEMMEQVKKLIGKEMSSDELIKFMAQATIEKIEKDKFKQVSKPRKSLPLALAKVGRLIPAHVKREVYLRDKKCSNCGTIHNLNFDHRKAFAMGGTSSAENIRLLCFGCNQRGRIRMRL